MKAREGWKNPREDEDRNLLRLVSGQEAYLQAHCEKSGTVELADALAHWWTLKDEPALTQKASFAASSGHVAALFQDELYEMVMGRTGVARLQHFGVIFGTNRVVVYVEPLKDSEGTIESNTARTHLLRNNEPLPWAQWAEEFRALMPDEIKVLMEEVAAGISYSDYGQSIRRRLNPIVDLFELSRYRPIPKPGVFLNDDSMMSGGPPGASDGKRGVATGTGGRSSNSAGSVYSPFLTTEDGTQGEDISGVELECKWVSLEDGTRIEGDMEDRAGKYFVEQNLLLLNRDFRVFKDMVDRWCTKYSHAPGSNTVVRGIVEEWFEQTLVEVIMGLQSLKGSIEWDIAQIAKASSEEALTTAVMPRYHTDVAIKRSLGAKLGTLKQPAS